VQRGRLVNQLAQDAFNKVCDKLESTCERGLYTLQDFSDMMCEILQNQGDENVYSVKHIKRQLEKNMENMFFAEFLGRKNDCVFSRFLQSFR